ncbi:MAG: LSM domain-containing protein [Candidatus Pacearchaeota archaeon]
MKKKKSLKINEILLVQEKTKMGNGIERPLDLLNQSKGKEILVTLKNDTQLVGTLMAFDIHINIVLENTKELVNGEIKRNIGLAFVRGDTIIYISPSTAAS